jgi:hypothetical protein
MGDPFSGLTPLDLRNLDTSALEQWLWDAACVIRGPVDAPKFKDFILPLLFFKRLSDVFEDEVGGLAADFGDAKSALKLVEQDHKLVRFFILCPRKHSIIFLSDFSILCNICITPKYVINM